MDGESRILRDDFVNFKKNVFDQINELKNGFCVNCYFTELSAFQLNSIQYPPHQRYNTKLISSLHNKSVPRNLHLRLAEAPANTFNLTDSFDLAFPDHKLYQ